MHEFVQSNECEGGRRRHAGGAVILECQNCGVPDDGHALSACIATLTVRAEKAEARVAELELGIKRLVWANDGTTAERPDIAWRDLKRLVCSKEAT